MAGRGGDGAVPGTSDATGDRTWGKSWVAGGPLNSSVAGPLAWELGMRRCDPILAEWLAAVRPNPVFAPGEADPPTASSQA